MDLKKIFPEIPGIMILHAERDYFPAGMKKKRKNTK